MIINNLSVNYAIICLAEMFPDHVISVFFNSDKEGVLERAHMTTSNGELTAGFG